MIIQKNTSKNGRFARYGCCYGSKAQDLVILVVFLFVARNGFSQAADSTQTLGHFAGGVTLTDNGISLIPTFSLGKPAAIFDLSLRKKKLSFEPQFRFSLEGKPWSFIFWWRYKLLETKRFYISAGAHPSFVFKTQQWVDKGISKELITTQRYWAGELSPNYAFSKNVCIGVYYLYSHGLEKDAIKNTHFLTLNAQFSKINLLKGFYLRLSPQLYYLKMDQQDGYYANMTLVLTRKKWPFSVSSILNKVIQTRITTSKDFVYNLSLTYTFHKTYVER